MQFNARLKYTLTKNCGWGLLHLLIIAFESIINSEKLTFFFTFSIYTENVSIAMAKTARRSVASVPLSPLSSEYIQPAGASSAQSPIDPLRPSESIYTANTSQKFNTTNNFTRPYRYVAACCLYGVFNTAIDASKEMRSLSFLYVDQNGYVKWTSECAWSGNKYRCICFLFYVLQLP